MGNTNQQIQKQLKFIQRLDDKHFGPIDIFKSEGTYIMKVDRHYVKGDLQQKQFQKIVTYTQSKQVKHIIPIIHINRQTQNGFCLAYERSSIYTQYYNHTLGDMLMNKKTFEQGQIWLILHNMLNLIFHLKFNQLAINLNLDTVFLTLKGLPCVSHHHIYSTQNSVNCCQAGMGQMLAKIIIQLIQEKSIEDFQEISEDNCLILSISKRYSLLGKVLKQLLSRQKDEKQLLDQIERLEIIDQIKKPKQIKLTKFKYIIPDNTIQTAQQFNQQGNRPQTPKKSLKDSKMQQIMEKLKEKQVPKTIISSQKRKSNSMIIKKDKENQNKVQKKTVNDFFPQKSNILAGKEESSKMMTDFEKKKKDYQAQMQKFKMKKQQLLCQSEKQNLSNSRPIQRQTQPKRNKGKMNFESCSKRKTEPNAGFRLR